ncbi:MAG: alkaline phosphatase family protein, partial [Rhodothermales bacterium]
PGEPVRKQNDLDRAEMTAYPSLYDAAYEAGLVTAEVNWPVTRGAETLHASFPDAPGAVDHMTESLRTELVELGILADESGELFGRMSYAGRDHVWTSAAAHVIRSRRPNVLLFHLLSVDGTHHAYGAGSQPAFTALAFADAQVRYVLDALEEAGIRDRATIFVVSDHGFMNVSRRIYPNVLLQEEGLLEVDADGQPVSARVHALSNGGSAMVFATDPATKDEDLDRARQLFEGAEGIARVLTPDEFEAFGLPDPSDSDQVGDLVLGAAQGYSFSEAATGDYVRELDGPSGVHGYFSDVEEMEALFIASGSGIRSGIELDIVDNRSIAATAARLLGVPLETADGQVLEEILE